MLHKESDVLPCTPVLHGEGLIVAHLTGVENYMLQNIMGVFVLKYHLNNLNK